MCWNWKEAPYLYQLGYQADSSIVDTDDHGEEWLVFTPPDGMETIALILSHAHCAHTCNQLLSTRMLTRLQRLKADPVPWWTDPLLPGPE
jgi:hypothetical protein